MKYFEKRYTFGNIFINMKLKTLLISLFVFAFTYPLTAQSRYPLIKYKRESYYKYPYKVKYVSYVLYTNLNYDEDIMPVADSLPDGKFVAYGDYIKYRLFHPFGKSVKVDTSKVAAVFNTKNGKKNGASLWYDKNGNLRRTGSYLNDERDGEWKTYDLFGRLLKIENYKNGLLSGDLIEYNLQGIIIKKGHFKNNEADGTWYIYYNDGKLKGFINIAPDSSQLTQSQYSKYYFNYLNNEIPDNYSYSLSSYNFYGPCEQYYHNGQFMFKRNLKEGHYSLNDTVYHENGRISELSVLLPGSNDTIHNYMYTEYDTAGKLTLEKLYVDRYMKYSKHYDKNGKIKEETYDYSSRKYISDMYPVSTQYGRYDNFESRAIDADLLKKDTILLLNATYNDGKPVSRKVLLLPYNIKLEKNINKNNLGFDYKVDKDAKSGQVKIQEFYYNQDSIFTLVKFSHSENDSTIVTDSVRPFCNGKLFTGKVEWYMKRKHANDIEITLKKGKLYVASSSYYYMIMNDPYLDFLKIDFTSMPNFYGTKGRIELFLKNGLPDSTLKIFDKENNLVFIERYKNSLPDGSCISYEKRPPRKGSIYRYEMGVVSYTFYKNGLKEDTCKRYHKNGRLSSIDVYKNDTLNGTSYTYNVDGVVTSITKYKNGELDGLSYDYNNDGILLSVKNYKNGNLDGISTFFDSETSMTSVVLNTDNGYFDGCSYKYYTGSQQVKKQFCYDIKDSVRIYGYSYFYENEYNDEYNYGDGICTANVEVTIFYKGGEKSAEGKYVDYKKYGIWKYWDETGTLVKQIKYFNDSAPDNFIAINNLDTITFSGNINEWYSNGTHKAEGYVMSEYELYDCRVEGDAAKQDIYYINYWTPKGEQMVKNKNGKLLTYHPNEIIETSTIIRNGLKDSIYKEWDPDGHLSKIGSYKYGLKEGRWLEGDLEGISYIDDQCFSSEEEFQNALRSRKENLYVREEYYINGEMVKQNSYSSNY
ncbi:MAG: hypothetical protein V1904_09115 [Bacteroidota bacterium]